MNWEAIGAIGEIVGAGAVVLTLAYLAVQVRQNTRQLDEQKQSVYLSTYTSIDESFSRFRLMLGSNPEVSELWNRAMADYESLDESDQKRAYQLIHEFLVMHQNLYGRLAATVGDDFASMMTTDMIAREMRNPGLLQWWRKFHQVHFVPAFRELAIGAVENTERTTQPFMSGLPE